MPDRAARERFITLLCNYVLSETMNKLPGQLRAVVITAGVISLIIGIVMLLYPGLAVTVVVYLLAFVLIIIGIERIIMGALG